jgi:hypothetical protein
MLDTIPGVPFQVSCTRPMLPYIAKFVLEKGNFLAFPKNHLGFTPKNIKINTYKIEIDCECGKPNAIENMIGCEGIKDRKTLQCMEE